MIRRPPRSTPLYSSAASDVYKRQNMCVDACCGSIGLLVVLPCCGWLLLAAVMLHLMLRDPGRGGIVLGLSLVASSRRPRGVLATSSRRPRGVLAASRMPWRWSSNRPRIVLGLFSDRSRRPQIVLKSSNRPQIVLKSSSSRPQSSSNRPRRPSRRPRIVLGSSKIIT